METSFKVLDFYIFADLYINQSFINTLFYLKNQYSTVLPSPVHISTTNVLLFSLPPPSLSPACLYGKYFSSLSIFHFPFRHYGYSRRIRHIKLSWPLSLSSLWINIFSFLYATNEGDHFIYIPLPLTYFFHIIISIYI